MNVGVSTKSITRFTHTRGRMIACRCDEFKTLSEPNRTEQKPKRNNNEQPQRKKNVGNKMKRILYNQKVDS